MLRGTTSVVKTAMIVHPTQSKRFVVSIHVREHHAKSECDKCANDPADRYYLQPSTETSTEPLVTTSKWVDTWGSSH